MSDADDFFAEQDKRMSIPDEDVDKYIHTRLASARQHRPTVGHIGDPESAGVLQRSLERRYPERALGKITADGNCTETSEVWIANPTSLSPLSGSSSTTPAAARDAKRRRITEHSILNPIVPEGPNPDPIASGTTARGGGVDGERLGVFHFTNQGSESARGPSMHLPSGVQTTDRAVLVTDKSSSYTNTPGLERKMVQPLKRLKPDTPLISIPPVTSTLPDSHKTNESGSPPRADEIPNDTLTITPTTVQPPTSRMRDGSHVAGCVGEIPVSGTPAGFHTSAMDISNVTSPTDMPSEQSRHVSGGSQEAQPSSSTVIPKQPKARKTVNSDRRSKKASSGGSRTKQVKEKRKLVTPLEYAQKLQSSVDLRPRTNYLKGKRIFYVGGDMTYASSTTRGRMEYIVKHGGTLVPKYDPAIVTHIVTDAGVRPTLQALSLKSLSDIPENIPTVTWDWVISGYGRASKRKSEDKGCKGESEVEGAPEDEDDIFDFEFMHAAFPERIDAGRSWKNSVWGKQGGKASHGVESEADAAHGDSGDISHISAFSQEGGPTQNERRDVPLIVLPPLPLDLRSVDGGKVEAHATSEEAAPQSNDPLSEYYAQARAEREAKWNRDASDSDDEDSDFNYHRVSVPKRGFTCDIKGKKPGVCVNQHIVGKLEELRELHKAKSSEDDRWRAYSYGKCIPAIRNHPKPIQSFSEARSIRGVGDKTALKIMEIINTGDLSRIKYENTEDVAATRVFQGIYGVGRNIAFAWFASGLRTLDDVRARKGDLKLSTAQEIGLKFYDDINTRMPREEAKRIFEMIKPIALAIDSNLFIEIMGSYRRGKADCGDIDILITRPTSDGKTHQGVLRTLLERLHTAGIVTEDLAVPDDFSDLELIYRGLCKLPEPGAKRRRIDFLCVPWVSRGAALLYYTGDDIFNRAMRLKANRHGYSLNQRGLYAGVVRDPHDRQKKVCEGHIIASETEEEIFKILGVPWQEPHERVRG